MKKTFLAILFLLIVNNKVNANNQWLTSFEDAKKIAIATNKLILVDFWAVWCGPCKRMDSESWSNIEVKKLMRNFVPLKIDIDIKKSLSSKYSVRGIPYIFILDPNGEIIYQKMSYMRKPEVISLLKKFSLNTSLFQSDYINYRNNKTGDNALILAEKYLDYSIFVDKKVKNNFLKVAEIYLKKTKTFYKKEGTKNKEKQRLFLLNEVYRKTLYNRTKSALKSLEKEVSEDVIEEKNKLLYAFLNFTLHNKLKNKEKAKLWYDKLKNDKLYLLKSRKILSI